MVKGRKVYEPPRYMTVNTAIQQILEGAELLRQDENSDVKAHQQYLSKDTIAVGVARLGNEDQLIKAGMFS